MFYILTNTEKYCIFIKTSLDGFWEFSRNNHRNFLDLLSFLFAHASGSHKGFGVGAPFPHLVSILRFDGPSFTSLNSSSPYKNSQELDTPKRRWAPRFPPQILRQKKSKGKPVKWVEIPGACSDNWRWSSSSGWLLVVPFVPITAKEKQWTAREEGVAVFSSCWIAAAGVEWGPILSIVDDQVSPLSSSFHPRPSSASLPPPLSSSIPMCSCSPLSISLLFYRMVGLCLWLWPKEREKICPRRRLSLTILFASRWPATRRCGWQWRASHRKSTFH